MTQKRIAVCLICTGKYDVFLPEILKSIDKYFLPKHSVSVEIFTDKVDEIMQRLYIKNLPLERIGLTYRRIESLKFPYATLYRYKKILAAPGAWYGSDYIYYMDVDMKIVDTVGDEILGDVVCVKHPGYGNVGGGAWCNDMNSTAYTSPLKRQMYYAGGFQGGSTKSFYLAMKQMDRNITTDEERGVLAPWHDESHWNMFLSTCKDKLVLNSDYCMVENMGQRKLWKIDHLSPKIIALDKNHADMRS